MELREISIAEAIELMQNGRYLYSDGLQFFMHNEVIYREFSADDESDSIYFRTITVEELENFSFWINING